MRIPGFGSLPLVALTVSLCAAGCHSNPSLVAPDNNQAGTQDQANDPAASNLAPVSTGSSTQVLSAQESAPSGSYSQTSDQDSYDPGYGEQPEYTASEPPPPLPDYDQPPPPDDGYLWTPGYWAWGPAGYYWVPGAWVQAPYEGALWTPGYWGYSHHHYGFYPGHWGQYIGYYGGVDYGFGYIGIGYQGGYWGGGHFNYNRSFNNLKGSRAQFVYNHPVSNYQHGARVSFNGGSGGLQVHARPAELAAMHQQHTAPMRAQIENEHAASTNRAQFSSVNHGRPASLVVAKPLAADTNVKAPAALQKTNRAVAQEQQRQATPEQRQAAPQEQRQTVPQPQHQAEQQREVAPQHQAAAQPQRQAAPRPQQQAAPQRQAAPQPQRQAAPQPQRSAAPQQQRQAAPQPQRQSAPQPQRQSAPQPQRQSAPLPQRQSAPQPQRQAAPQKEEGHPGR